MLFRSRETIAAFIKKNLDEAIPELPLESAISADDKGRISKGAAEAMKAISDSPAESLR